MLRTDWNPISMVDNGIFVELHYLLIPLKGLKYIIERWSNLIWCPGDSLVHKFLKWN